jgi:hypothetical protein
MEGKPSIEIPITQLPVQLTSSETNVDAVVYLNRNSSSEARLISLPAGTATQRASGELFSAGEIRAKHERLLEILWDVPTYELQYRELAGGIKALESLTSQA